MDMEPQPLHIVHRISVTGQWTSDIRHGRSDISDRMMTHAGLTLNLMFEVIARDSMLFANLVAGSRVANVSTSQPRALTSSSAVL